MTQSTAGYVGSRLSRAREEKGISQAHLAEMLNRSQAAISQWESGRRLPGVQDLVEIAQVLERDVSEFIPRPRREGVHAALRAIAARLDQSALSQDLELFLRNAEGGPRPDRTIKVTSGIPQSAAEEILNTGSVGRPPIDVYDLASRCGVAVVELDFQEDLSGLVAELDDTPTIGVNAQHSPTRRRFTTAHELGHVILTHHDRFHIDLEHRMEHSASPLYDWRNEREANEFAANLLMPEEWVRKLYGPDVSVLDLADTFGVSSEAMGYRLVNLKLR